MLLIMIIIRLYYHPSAVLHKPHVLIWDQYSSATLLWSNNVYLCRCMRNIHAGAAWQLPAGYQGILPAAHTVGTEGRAYTGIIGDTKVGIWCGKSDSLCFEPKQLAWGICYCTSEVRTALCTANYMFHIVLIWKMLCCVRSLPGLLDSMTNSAWCFLGHFAFLTNKDIFTL